MDRVEAALKAQRRTAHTDTIARQRLEHENAR
jgi:hypothetical protein